MTYKIEKKEENLEIYIDGELIESYSFEKAITFELLMAKLLEKDMTEKINAESYADKDFSDNDKKLEKIVAGIINDFNEKCDEYTAFKKELS